MRQKEDLEYAKMLERVRIGSITDEDLLALFGRFISVLEGKGRLVFVWKILYLLIYYFSRR